VSPLKEARQVCLAHSREDAAGVNGPLAIHEMLSYLPEWSPCSDLLFNANFLSIVIWYIAARQTVAASLVLDLFVNQVKELIKCFNQPRTRFASWSICEINDNSDVQ
jgi:hypothetical protein